MLTRAEVSGGAETWRQKGTVSPHGQARAPNGRTAAWLSPQARDYSYK